MSDELHFMPLLTVTNGPLRGASFRLGPGRHRIGREEGVDVLLDDPKVSRRHATVELTGGRALLADTGSTNGTWLNDRRIGGSAVLRDGDRIRLGHVELRFFDPGSAPTEPVGTLGYRPPAAHPEPVRPPASPDAGAAPGGPASPGGALTAPTQVIGTPRRPGRRLAVIGGCLILVGSLTWVYLAL
ncbi:FHA domain-containing protein [Micromonospora sp. HM5-17]|uniref:FHA domain-containing protein n=1 Tax=Micromonospora sp. HM5-17 TaxID=2487710 RepID=UPI000F4AC272|nr:FHA domain-containing protein [Micromonospora sp. HM5-17]ROT31616.1 FHA domain-containing protein [Micromonospora sp. HM5-17]